MHVRKDGQWLFSSVRDSPFQPPNNSEHLRGLDWAVGDWAGSGAGGEIERLTVSWNETQNSLNATFSTTIKNVSVGHATHWIGWDPLEKRVCSWIFDASGAFGDGTWTRDGKTWTLKTSSVLQDGKKAAATYVLTPVDANNLTLETKDRSEDGTAIPGSRTVNSFEPSEPRRRPFMFRKTLFIGFVLIIGAGLRHPRARRPMGAITRVTPITVLPTGLHHYGYTEVDRRGYGAFTEPTTDTTMAGIGPAVLLWLLSTLLGRLRWMVSYSLAALTLG